MAGELRNRQGVHNLTADDTAVFRDTYSKMMAISDNRGFQHFSGLHGAPNWYCWHHQQNAHSAVNMQIFLPWHRAYLYNFEMAMRDVNAAARLPWWDWTLRPPRQTGLPTIFTDARTPSGAVNPLRSFSIDLPTTRPPIKHATVRAPHAPDGLPTQNDVDDALSRTDWNDFCDALEDVHDGVHGWVSGDMGLVQTSAFDPIFYSHHAMIDRIWAIWQVRNGNSNIPSELLDVVLAPFNFRVRDVLSVNALGYDYAAFETVVAQGGGN